MSHDKIWADWPLNWFIIIILILAVVWTEIDKYCMLYIHVVTWYSYELCLWCGQSGHQRKCGVTVLFHAAGVGTPWPPPPPLGRDKGLLKFSCLAIINNH